MKQDQKMDWNPNYIETHRPQMKWDTKRGLETPTHENECKKREKREKNAKNATKTQKNAKWGWKPIFILYLLVQTPHH
jgi:hypothetical protein